MRRIALCAALAIAALPAAQALAAKPRMSPAVRADIPGKRLFDIGVADPDRDGWQDIFTTNHKFASVFLHNDHGRSFDNQIEELGLGPDGRFPGLELLTPPDMSSPGLYIWPTDDTGEAGRLHIASTGLTATGQLKLMTKNLSVRSQDGADAALARDEDDRPYIDFTIHPGGDLIVSSNGLSDLPITFRFAGSGVGAVPADQIHVGTRAVSPDDSTFQFKLRDRHGIAFADVGGDSDEDAFVATGGLGGGIAEPALSRLRRGHADGLGRGRTRRVLERDRGQRHRQEHLPRPSRLLRGRRRRRQPRPPDDLRGRRRRGSGRRR